MFVVGAVATGGKVNPSGNLFSLQKELWLDGCLGVEPRRGGIVLAEGLSDFGGGIIVV
jgi:hypothetical protein